MNNRLIESTSMKPAISIEVLVFGFVVLMAIISRVLQIDHTPQYDEFYHLLAAKGLLEHGKLVIADGEYVRGAFFTYLISLLFSIFDQSITVARIASLVPGVLLIAAVYLWSRKAVSLSAALWSAFLLIFCPIEIYISQFVRFYALHAMVFFLGAIFWYGIFIENAHWRIRVVYAIGAMLCLFFSLSLQVTTAIGLMGLVTWTVLFWLWRCANELPAASFYKILVVFLVVVTSVLLILWKTEILVSLWDAFRSTPGWAEFAKDNYRYYHDWFLRYYPTLWTLLPIAGLVALCRRSRPACFAGVLFVTGIIIHSIAGTKGSRYIAYLLPFLFVFWGVVIADVVPAIGKLAANLVELLSLKSKVSQKILSKLILVFSLFIVFSGNEAFYIAARMVTDKEPGVAKVSGYRGFSDWEAALPILTPLADKASFLMTSTAPKAIYYMGRSDAEINAQQLLYKGERLPEFGIDPRLGRPIISTPQSIKKLMDCNKSGLIIIEEHHWRIYWAVMDESADFIEASMTKVKVPQKSRLVVYKWDDDIQTNNNADCLGLYPINTH